MAEPNMGELMTVLLHRSERAIADVETLRVLLIDRGVFSEEEYQDALKQVSEAQADLNSIAKLRAWLQSFSGPKQ